MFSIGVTSKLDYLTNLGVGSVWMSPVYKSGGKDGGYDVVDHKDIDPTLGTMDDFNELVQTLHDNGIKLIMDFIPNHSSADHDWFKKSRNREEPYTDYYIWKDCNPRQMPNNWVRMCFFVFYYIIIMYHIKIFKWNFLSSIDLKIHLYLISEISFWRLCMGIR